MHPIESCGRYYALVKKGGKQFRRSLKTKDRNLAERRLKEIKEKIGGLAVGEDAKLTFEEVARKCWLESIKHTLAASTIIQREIRIKNLAPFFASKPIRNVTPADCEKWVVKRGAELAPQTFVHELDTMRAVFDYARRHGLILSSPAADIRRPKITFAKIVVPSRDQFRNLVAAIRQSDGRSDSQAKSKAGADLVEFLAYSGARIGEARAVRWNDVKFEANQIWIHGTKSETSDRLVPMTTALRCFLERLHTEDKPKATDPIGVIKSAKKALQTTCRKLRYPSFTHHDFRHFFATTCIESGVDIPTISRWLGHSDGGALAMKVYGHLRQEHSNSMIKKVTFDDVTSENFIPLPTAGPGRGML